MEEQNQKCNSPPWTLFERKLRSYQYNQCNDLNLHESIKQRMGDSSLKSFLYHLNQTQKQETFIQQDKLERMLFDITKGLVNVNKLERSDDICDNLFGYIDQYLRKSPSGTMTVKNVLKGLDLLRLTGSKITNIDETLRRMEELKVLILAGNCISSCPGGRLPRGLMIIEICFNLLENINCLADDPPPYLLYLGLARNYLTSGVLAPLRSFEMLCHLDLSQNNIEDLAKVVAVCSQLRNLSSLLLIGNPCSMSTDYLTFVLKKMTNLLFLDGELLKKHEGNEETDIDSEPHLTGSLHIHLFRIMGLPQPSNLKINKKKVVHSFRLEVESPLLHTYLLDKDNSFIVDETLVDEEVVNKSEKQDGKKKKDAKDSSSKGQKTKSSDFETNKGKNKSSGDLKGKEQKKSLDNETSKGGKKSSKDTKSKKGKKLSQEIKGEEISEELNSKEKQDDEMYEMELKIDQKSSEKCFKSERKNWGKIIEFNEPAIEVSDCDLVSLRDVFRTDLTLRIVHLKTLPPAVKGKSKPKKQEKKSSTEGKNYASGGEDENKEILVSKSTLAKIKVPLQDILWTKKYLEYSWTVTKPYIVEPTTDLKNLQYVIKKKKEPKNKKIEDKSGEVPIPSVLTCHIGIGVKRDALDLFKLD